jgi:hypothetical protein
MTENLTKALTDKITQDEPKSEKKVLDINPMALQHEVLQAVRSIGGDILTSNQMESVFQVIGHAFMKHLNPEGYKSMLEHMEKSNEKTGSPLIVSS